MKVEFSMNEGNENMTSTGDLLGQLANGSMSDAESTFKALMDRKVGEAIREKQADVAKQMFGQDK